MKANYIYFIGVGVLGLSYSFLKEAFTPPVFFAICIVYLLIVSLLAKKYGKNKNND